MESWDEEEYWVLVMFDIPVGDKTAGEFRHLIKKLGMHRVQLSVYARSVWGQFRAKSLSETLSKRAPELGLVQTFILTGEQYRRSLVVNARIPQKPAPEAMQLTIF